MPTTVVYHLTSVSKRELMVIPESFKPTFESLFGPVAAAPARVIVVPDGSTITAGSLSFTATQTIKGFTFDTCGYAQQSLTGFADAFDAGFAQTAVKSWGSVNGALSPLLNGPFEMFRNLYGGLPPSCLQQSFGFTPPDAPANTTYTLGSPGFVIFRVKPNEEEVGEYVEYAAGAFTFSIDSPTEVLEDTEHQAVPGGGGPGPDPDPDPQPPRKVSTQVSWVRFYNAYAVIPPGSNTLPPQSGGPTPV